MEAQLVLFPFCDVAVGHVAELAGADEHAGMQSVGLSHFVVLCNAFPQDQTDELP